MSLVFVDAADRYVVGEGEVNGMLGPWAAVPTGPASGNAQVVIPSFGARTGQKAFYIDTIGTTGDLRGNIQGSAIGEIFLAIALYLPALPSVSNLVQIRLHDSSNLVLCYFNVEPTGRIAFRNSSGTVIAETTDIIITSGEWKFLEFRVLMGNGSGVVQIRDAAGITLLSVSSLVIPGTIAIIVPRSQNSGATAAGRSFYFTDLSVKSTATAFQNTWYPAGGVANYLLRPNSDSSAAQWPYVARRTFNNGVGQSLLSGDEGFSVPDSAGLEVGSGAFTAEGNFRWDTVPTAGATQTLMAKWRSGTDQRSWRLFLYESGGNTFLGFEYSTDGTTGTVVVVHDFPFSPVRWRKYSIAVSRTGGFNRLFIDGVRVGPATADSATYFNATSVMSVSAVQSGSSTLTDSFRGWMDEARFTVGVGRYIAEYTPITTAFPRDVAGDPSFASVQLLIGWDNGFTIDQSSAGRIVSIRGIATALVTDDGFFGFQSIDKSGRDDTFVFAQLTSASGTFELTANPLNDENVRVGPTTYRFRTTLAAANDILIGVDTDATMSNLLAAVNFGPGIGTLYGTGTVINPDCSGEPLPGAIGRMVAVLPGTAGNALVFTTTVTGAVISGAGTLTGGLNIPVASEYGLERIPRGITRIDSVSLFTRRSVFGTGGATVQPGFVDSALAVSNGADTSPSATPSWQIDLFSSNGGVAWTTTAMLGSKVRVNRTT